MFILLKYGNIAAFKCQVIFVGTGLEFETFRKIPVLIKINDTNVNV